MWVELPYFLKSISKNVLLATSSEKSAKKSFVQISQQVFRILLYTSDVLVIINIVNVLYGNPFIVDTLMYANVIKKF